MVPVFMASTAAWIGDVGVGDRAQEDLCLAELPAHDQVLDGLARVARRARALLDLDDEQEVLAELGLGDLEEDLGLEGVDLDQARLGDEFRRDDFVVGLGLGLPGLGRGRSLLLCGGSGRGRRDLGVLGFLLGGQGHDQGQDHDDGKELSHWTSLDDR
jgi:hypothetical protein